MALADFIALPDTPMPSYSAGIDEALARNAALAQQQAQQAQSRPRGLKFGSPIRNFLGALGDAISVGAGGKANYHDRMAQQRQQSAIGQYLGSSYPEIAGLVSNGVDIGDAASLYKAIHPTNEQPADIREYLYAKSPEGGGFTGSYMDWKQQQGSPLIANNGDGTFTIVPRNLVGQGGSQSPTGAPQPGAVEDGYRFKGGDPADQNNWEPVGGAGGNASGSFPVSKVLDALTYQESGGNGTAVSPKGALGSTQLMPGTAKEMAAKRGLAFVPGMLKSNDPTAKRYQRALAEAYLQQGYDATGNLRDALRYYHGGPNTAIWGPKTNAYADAILSRLEAM